MWLQKAQMHNRPLGQPGEVYPWCLCPQTTSSWSLFLPWKGIRDNLAVWYHAWFTQGWIERKASHLCFRVPQGPQVQSTYWCDPIRRIWHRGRCPHWRSIGGHLLWSQDQWLTPPYSTGYLQSPICWRLGHLLPWKLSSCHWKTSPTCSGRYPRVGTTEWLQICCAQVQFTAPRRKPERQPNIMIRHVALPVEETTKLLGLWWDSKLNFGKHITAKKQQRSYKSSESCRPYQVGRRPRHASYVVLSNCPLQVGLWMHCIWFGIHLQPQQTQHYPQHRP